MDFDSFNFTENLNIFEIMGVIFRIYHVDVVIGNLVYDFSDKSY